VAIASLSCCLQLGCHPHGSLLCLFSPASRSFVAKLKIHRLPVFLLACGSLRAAGCHDFCNNAKISQHTGNRLYLPMLKSKKSRQPLCSSVPFRAFVENQITKALHSTSHIASLSSATWRNSQSGTLAPLAGRLAKLVCRAATRSVALRSLHPPASRFWFSCVPSLNSII